MNSLYLVDSSIYVFKAWFSLPDTLVNRAGEPNNAWLGFTDFAYQFLSGEKPRQVVFAFDESLKHSARNAIYPEYKANRAPAPEELKRQFQWCREWLRMLGISEVASDRHEADDLIGSLAVMHRSQQTRIVILTADKDLAQLVRDQDVWWSYATGQQLNYRALTRRFGVRPEQIADQLALAGDKVDNIPGIPGVGMKIAARLLTKFGELQNLRDNLDQVKSMKFRGAERVMHLLQEHEAILDISQQLTGIDCSVDAMKDVSILQGPVDVDGLEQMMAEQQMGDVRQRKWLDLVDSRR
jgi:5'-3' exonuclease